MLKPLILFYFILNSTCSTPLFAELACSDGAHCFNRSIVTAAPSIPGQEESHSNELARLSSKRSRAVRRTDPDHQHKSQPPSKPNLNRNSAAKFISKADSPTRFNLKHKSRSITRSAADSNQFNMDPIENVDLVEAIKLKCYLNIIRSLRKMSFVDFLLVRRDRVRSNWYRQNEQLCRRFLHFKSSAAQSYRFFPGLIELKLEKMRLTFILIKWKLDVWLKFTVFFWVIVLRFKQAIFGRNVIRDEDINLLIRLFFPELFSPQSGGLTDPFKQIA